MKVFHASSGTTLKFESIDEGTKVSCSEFPTVGDLVEFADYVKEQRWPGEETRSEAPPFRGCGCGVCVEARGRALLRDLKENAE